MSWLHELILSSDQHSSKTLLKKISDKLKLVEDYENEVNKPDDNGFSPLFIALILRQGGQPLGLLIALLEKYGARVNSTDLIADAKLVARNSSISSIFDVALCLNDEPTERYPESPSPKDVLTAETVPINPQTLQRQPVRELEKTMRKKWVQTYMYPRGLNSLVHMNKASRQKYSVEQLKIYKAITEPCNNFVVADMPKFGKGLFAGPGGLAAGNGFFYAGLLQKKEQPSDPIYSKVEYNPLLTASFGNDDEWRMQIVSHLHEANCCLNGANYFNFTHLMQHLMSHEELNRLTFNFPNMQKKIATANVAEIFGDYNGNFENLLCTIEPIEEYHIVGIDYGIAYWRSKNIVPAIFDKLGRYVSPVFYSGRVIFLRTGEARTNDNVIKGDYISVANEVIEQTVKSQGICATYSFTCEEQTFEIDRKWLVDQDIIPEVPEFLAKPCQEEKSSSEKLREELELRFLAAAMAGDFNTIRYLLEWHQPQVAINIQSNLNKNTALHYAALKGDYYLVLYLLIKGAALDIKNAAGKTAIECTTDKEIIEAINLYRTSYLEVPNQTLSEKRERKKESEGELLSRLSLHAYQSSLETLPPETLPDIVNENLWSDRRIYL